MLFVDTQGSRGRGGRRRYGVHAVFEKLLLKWGVVAKSIPQKQMIICCWLCLHEGEDETNNRAIILY